MSTDPRVRLATVEDARAAAELMHRFNAEYDEPIDEPDVLERRYRAQLSKGRPDGPVMLYYEREL